MYRLIKVDSFLTTFITLMHRRCAVTEEQLLKLFQYVQDVDADISVDVPLFTAWQKIVFEREYEGIFNLITNNAADLGTPQSEFEKTIRSIPYNHTKGLFVLLYGAYGNPVLRARGVMSRISALAAFTAVSFTYGADYTLSVIGGMPHGQVVNKYLADIVGRLNFDVLNAHRMETNQFNIINNAYAPLDVLPPDNLVSVTMLTEERTRKRVYGHILTTRDPAYAPVLHTMCTQNGTEGKAAYYMAKSLGNEFANLPPCPSLHENPYNDTDILWKWFNREATDAELNEGFDWVLNAYNVMFTHMVRYNMGIAIPCKINLTAKRYKKILTLAKGQDRSKGLIGPFIIKDSPFIGIKITRKEYNGRQTKKPG